MRERIVNPCMKDVFYVNLDIYPEMIKNVGDNSLLKVRFYDAESVTQFCFSYTQLHIQYFPCQEEYRCRPTTARSDITFSDHQRNIILAESLEKDSLPIPDSLSFIGPVLTLVGV